MTEKTLEEEFDDVSVLDEEAEAVARRIWNDLRGEQESYVNDDENKKRRSRSSWDFYISTLKILRFISRREGYSNIGRFIEIKIFFPYVKHYFEKNKIKVIEGKK